MKSAHRTCWILVMALISGSLVITGHGTWDPMVTLQQGPAAGKTIRSTSGKLFNAFLGIPYGKVVQRFAAAEPAGPWSGLLDATKDGCPCMQINFFTRGSIIGIEDCLTLNVYTPVLSSNDNASSLLPVIAYIYGGGFSFGEATSTLFGPEIYMNSRNPFVLVLMNYRVGSLGFLSTNDEASLGNYGLLDQVMALKWIQKNIGAFNGDKDKVTLQGQSAGSASVSLHLLSPLSSGLFHRAISQSGSAICQWVIDKNPLSNAQEIAKQVNCPTTTSTDMVECLRKADAEAIVRAVGDIHQKQGFSLPSKPVVENPNGGKFLTEQPLTLLEEGRFNKVPVISGITEHEGAFFVFLMDTYGLLPSLESDQDGNWQQVMNKILFSPHVDPSVWKPIQEKYFKDLTYPDISSFLLQLSKLSTDGNFKSCNDKIVRLLSAGGVPVYTYFFDYTNADLTPSHYSGRPDVGHAADLYFFFNFTESGLKNLSREAQVVSDQVIDMWTNFATFGNPTPSGPIRWDVSTPEETKYLNISLNPHMVQDYQEEDMQFWDSRSI